MREEARGEVTADSRAAAAARLHFPTNKYPPRSIRSLYLYPSSFVCTLVMRLTPTGSRPGSPRERLGRELALHRIRTPKQAGRQAGDDNNSRFYSGGSVHVVVVVNSSAHIGTMYVDSKRIVNRWNASKCTRRGSTNLQNVQIWMPSPGWL